MLNFWIGFLICFILIGVINTIILIALNKKDTDDILKWVILISSPLTVILYFICLGAYRIIWYFFGYSIYRDRRNHHRYFVLVHPFLGNKLKHKNYLYNSDLNKLVHSKKYFENNYPYKNKKKLFFNIRYYSY